MQKLSFYKTIIPTSLFVLFFIFSVDLKAQPRKQYIDIQVNPTKQNWTYKLGDKVNFKIKVSKNRHLLSGIKISYQIGAEQMPPTKVGELTLKKGVAVIKGYTLRHPGFLQCRISLNYKGKNYYAIGTAAFEPEQIKTTTRQPLDFDAFWLNTKQELAALSIDAEIEPQPELSTPTIKVYQISLQNARPSNFWQPKSRIYGMLSVPNKKGKFPAILELPGAGVRAYGRSDKAAKEVIVLKMGIHGIPVNLKNKEYRSFEAGPLNSYWTKGIHDKDIFYWKRVIQGGLRAIDFLFTMPEFDGQNLAVTGISQGGGLAIITAGLDDRVKYLAVLYPGLVDFTGYLKGRAGGWPHYYKKLNAEKEAHWLNTTPYFDGINFTPNLKASGWYSWGYNDTVCPPTSMYAAYNAIMSPKELHVFEETGHWTFPEQLDLMERWLLKQLKNSE